MMTAPITYSAYNHMYYSYDNANAAQFADLMYIYMLEPWVRRMIIMRGAIS